MPLDSWLWLVDYNEYFRLSTPSLPDVWGLIENWWSQGGIEYRQVSSIRRTKPQHLKDSRTVLRLSLPNPLKPDVKSRMKM